VRVPVKEELPKAPHSATYLVAVHGASKFKRHRHWLSDRNLLRNIVTIDRTVKDFDRIPVGHLAALKYGAFPY